MYSEYQKEVARTAQTYDDERLARLYFSLGLVGEATELLGATLVLDTNAIRKELGDVCWYTAHLMTVFGIDLEDVEPLREGGEWSGLEAAMRTVLAAGALGEVVKKIVRDGRAVDHGQLRRMAASVLGEVSEVAWVIGTNQHEIMRENVAKLRKRYPTGFNAADAIARKDGEELREG